MLLLSFLSISMVLAAAGAPASVSATELASFSTAAAAAAMGDRCKYPTLEISMRGSMGWITFTPFHWSGSAGTSPTFDMSLLSASLLGGSCCKRFFFLFRLWWWYLALLLSCFTPATDCLLLAFVLELVTVLGADLEALAWSNGSPFEWL